MKKCKRCNGDGWVTYQKDVPCGFCIAQELDIKICPNCEGKRYIIKGLEASGEAGTLSAYDEAGFDSR